MFSESTTLKIVVTGARPMAAESFWPEIERFIGVMVGGTAGVLTRISRPDNKCNYRDYGIYHLTYSAKWSEYEVELEVR